MTTATAAPPAAPDRELADALLLRRDEAAFRALYRRHTPRLFQVVLRVLGGAELDAEDVVQETWIRATERLGDFRWEADPENVPEPWSAPVPVGERIDLERALALLPAGYRAVLVLHDVEGFTHEEIAGMLGVVPGTSKSQLSCARRAMRQLLEPMGKV